MKPKEFWIVWKNAGQPYYLAYENKPLDANLPVIEYSAYAKLQAEVERLKVTNQKLLEDNLHIENKISNRCADLLSERAEEQARLKLMAECYRKHLEYCWEKLCKHDAELRPGNNREWCLKCQSWVYESDKKATSEIRAALEGE